MKNIIIKEGAITTQTIEMNNCKIEISFCENTRIQSIVKSTPYNSEYITLYIPPLASLK